MSDRAEFESTVRATWSDSYSFTRDTDGHYCDDVLDGMWWAWQAAPAQGDAEPVAWLWVVNGSRAAVPRDYADELIEDGETVLPLYTHPHNGEQGGEWVRCDERMPTEADADWDDDVIVFDSEGDMAVTHYGVVEQCGQPGGSITHWMPTGLKRPQPPKEGSGDE